MVGCLAAAEDDDDDDTTTSDKDKGREEVMATKTRREMVGVAEMGVGLCREQIYDNLRRFSLPPFKTLLLLHLHLGNDDDKINFQLLTTI